MWAKAFTIKDDPKAVVLRKQLGVATGDAHVYVAENLDDQIEAERAGIHIKAFKVDFGNGRVEVLTLDEAEAFARAFAVLTSSLDAVLNDRDPVWRRVRINGPIKTDLLEFHLG
jgi:hypothetical protein